MLQLGGSEAGGILSYSGESSPFVLLGRQLIRRDPPTLGRALCFSQSTNSNARLLQNAPTDTPRTRFGQIPGITWPRRGDT